METTSRECPLCRTVLVEQEGVFSCAEHGDWYAYGANLLVRAPSAEQKAPTRFSMPWEPVTYPSV